MGGIPLSTPTSEVIDVTGASAPFATVMVSGQQYLLSADVSIWYRISETPDDAEEGVDDSHFLQVGRVALVAASGAANLVTVIKKTGQDDGFAVLAPLRAVT